MPSGGSQPTQTTKTEMSPEQKQLFNLALPGVKEYAATAPERYPGTTIAPFDPNQLAGQAGAIGAAGTQAGLASGAAGSLPFFFGDLNNTQTNDMLRNSIDAAVRPITTNLLQNQLPAVRSEFGMGNFGASRQGIAEGGAIQGAQQAIGDTSAKLAGDLYKTNISAKLQALGLLPTVQQAQLAGPTTQSAVGDVQQARQQAILNEQVGNFNFDQYAPFLQSKDIMALMTGLPGGTVTSNANTPAINPATQALGGAAAGASLGSMIMPGPGTAVGAGAGALLPFLFK